MLSPGVLNLANNDFSGSLPDALTGSKLSYLELYDNSLTGTIPEEIGNSRRLRKSVELLARKILNVDIPLILCGSVRLQR